MLYRWGPDHHWCTVWDWLYGLTKSEPVYRDLAVLLLTMPARREELKMYRFCNDKPQLN